MGCHPRTGSLERVIDLRLLREDPDRVRASQRARGEDVALVDALLSADERRRSSGVRFDELRAEQKSLGKLIPKATPEERAELLQQAEQLKADVKAADADAERRRRRRPSGCASQLGNLVHPDVPVGGEEDFVVLETHGTIRDFGAEGFEPKDHLELGEALGAIDVERGAKVSGSRFYYLTGVGALLELALVNAAIAQATEAGFIPMLTPALVRPRAMEGTGFLGQAAENVYHLEKDDYYLVGTSEVPLAAYHMDEILDADKLPLRYAGFSPCFRREAGTYGKDTRGIFRVHQFDKVEMFSYVAPEDAEAEHKRLLEWEKQWLTAPRAAVPGHRRGLGRPGLVGVPQVRLRGVDPDPGQVPRADVGLQLRRASRRAGCPSACATARRCSRSPRSTARCAPYRARSWRSWRTTSRPTARSGCPRCCARTWAAGRSWSRSPSERRLSRQRGSRTS